jgi:hypothetical protein
MIYSYSLEGRVLRWIETRLGMPNVHPRERAMRLLEETVELAQAEGITREMVERQVQHVYGRPASTPEEEGGGVAVCFLGWCASRGMTMMEVAQEEVDRIEKKPVEEIRASLARKANAGLVFTTPPEPVDFGDLEHGDDDRDRGKDE